MSHQPNDRDRVLDIAVSVNSATNLEDIIRIVMRRIRELMRFDRASLALHDPDTDTLEICDLSGTGQGPCKERGKRIPVDESNALGWALLNRAPDLRRSLSQSGRFKPQQDGQEVESHIIAPLIGRKDALGLLNVGSHKPHAFNVLDVSLVCNYARLIAVAIENMKNFEKVQQLSVRDGLTGAYNRRHFEEHLAQEIDRVKRYDHTFSLLMLDIDSFKSFNDEFGHQAGDHVLEKTVELLREVLRLSDLVFRFGGEEFAVVLSSTGPAQAEVVAEKLLATLRERNVYRPNRSTIRPVTASIGLSSAPEDAKSADAIVACADQALYRAKATGRDRAVTFSSIDAVQRIGKQLREGTSVKELSGGLSGLNPHTGRLIDLADLIAAQLEFQPEQRINMKLVALYHDIGEVGIPHDVLQRPGSLDARERGMLTTHPVIGESFLSRIIRVGDVLAGVLHQKERYDGTGFPRGLAGEKIPLLARILAVVEVFDALVEQRPYQERYRVDEAYAVLRDAAGFQLDPTLVEALIEAHGARHGATAGATSPS